MVCRHKNLVTAAVRKQNSLTLCVCPIYTSPQNWNPILIYSTPITSDLHLQEAQQ